MEGGEDPEIEEPSSDWTFIEESDIVYGRCAPFLTSTFLCP